MGSTHGLRRTTVLGALFVIAALFSFSIVQVPAHAVGTARQEQLKHAQMIADIFDQHNAQRKANGLKPLVFSPDISLRVTQPFTNKLAAANNGTIWHNTAANIATGGRSWAENVAGGYKGESAAALVKRWMASPGHRKNILTASYTTISIGFAVPASGDWTFSTTNFYGSPTSPGVTYRTGAEWLASLTPPSDPSVNVYLTPGTHNINGRLWRTSCEPYSQTKRCRTEIQATQVQQVGGKFVSSTGWAFNNLTYAPSPRSLWKGNPLGGNGVVGGSVSWTSGGRKWRTECDTALTGSNGCRSYTRATVIKASGSGYKVVEAEIFNNMVVFSG